MKKASRIMSFALAAGLGVMGAASAFAQPDADDVFRDQDRRAFPTYSCSKDGALIEGVFFVTPSFSDMKRSGTAISSETIKSEISKAASSITAALTGEEIENDSEKANEVFGRNVFDFQSAVEQKSGGISIQVNELNFVPIDPATQPDLPACSGGSGGGAPKSGDGQPRFSI